MSEANKAIVRNYYELLHKASTPPSLTCSTPSMLKLPKETRWSHL